MFVTLCVIRPQNAVKSVNSEALDLGTWEPKLLVGSCNGGKLPSVERYMIEFSHLTLILRDA